MKVKYIPAILMLSGGLITVVLTYLRDFTITAKLGSLIIVLVVLFLVGNVIKSVIEYFDKVNQKKLEEEEKARQEAEELALATDGTVEEK